MEVVAKTVILRQTSLLTTFGDVGTFKSPEGGDYLISAYLFTETENESPSGSIHIEVQWSDDPDQPNRTKSLASLAYGGAASSHVEETFPIHLAANRTITAKVAGDSVPADTKYSVFFSVCELSSAQLHAST